MTCPELKYVQHVLTPDQYALFMRMPVDAQRHSLNVLSLLREAGQMNTNLHEAALLHDVGKVAAADAGVSLGLWLRGPLVVLEWLAPDTLKELASPLVDDGWRYALYVHCMHPQIGAEWARRAGCGPISCWLIAHHQDVAAVNEITDEERLRLLALLQWADARC